MGAVGRVHRRRLKAYGYGKRSLHATFGRLLRRLKAAKKRIVLSTLLFSLLQQEGLY